MPACVLRVQVGEASNVADSDDLSLEIDHTNTKKRIASAYKKISRTPNQSGHRAPLMPTRTDSILKSIVVPLQWAHSFVPLTSCRHGEKLYDAACSVFVLVSTLEPRGTIFHWKLFDISLLSCDIFRAPWRR